MNAYVRAALSRACAAIRAAQNGAQETTLHREAYSIGGLIGLDLAESEAFAVLHAATKAAGLWRAAAEYRAQAQVFARARHGKAVDAAQRARAASDGSDAPMPATGHCRLGKRPASATLPGRRRHRRRDRWPCREGARTSDPGFIPTASWGAAS
jgi:hypothetical protein